MQNRILNSIKKVIAILAIIMLFTTNVAYGFTIGGKYKANPNEQKSIIVSFFDKIFSFLEKLWKGEYDLEDFLKDLKKLEEQGTENVELEKILALTDKLPDGWEKLQIIGTINSYSVLSKSGNPGFNIGSLVKILINLVSSLVDGVFGIIGGDGIGVQAKDITIPSDTVSAFAGEDYKVNLHANIYKNKQNTNKWALLIHPFMMSGKTMANSVAPFYYEKGYNILAIDLRGFGESDGSVALGLLESLDVYDWLVEMNEDTQTFGTIDHIIVHGTSLGGATTNFLSGIDQFMADTMQLKSLKELNVKGLVSDCGYKNMEQFADKSFIMSLGVGLTDDNFAYYSNALNSLGHCELPMLIIHGDADTMVNYNNNAPAIRDAVNSSTRGGSAELVTIKGGAHAIIIMGTNATYTQAVNNFIDTYGK